MRTLRALLTIVVLFLLTSMAWAQDAATAEVLFDEGKKLLDEGKYEEACKKLAASLEADASGGAALNLGRCNEERGKPATAWANYKQAVVLFRAKGETDRETFAQERADALGPKLSRLTIEAVKTPGLVVTRNGETVTSGALGTAVPVDPAEYTIEATAEGYESWSTTVRVGPDGDNQTASIPALKKAAARNAGPPGGDEPVDPDDGDGPNVMVISGGVLLGLGAAAAIAGAVVGGMVLSGSSDAENDPALCSDKTCTPEGRKEIDSLEGQALAANVLIIAGSAVAVGGAVLVILGMMDEGMAEAEGDMALLPSVSPDGASMQIIGRF